MLLGFSVGLYEDIRWILLGLYAGSCYAWFGPVLGAALGPGSGWGILRARQATRVALFRGSGEGRSLQRRGLPDSGNSWHFVVIPF